MLLASMSASTVVSYFLAMALRVSPLLMVYTNGVGEGVRVGVGVEVLAAGRGMSSSWSTLMMVLVFRPLACRMALVVVPYSLAMVLTVSPDLTVWRVVSGGRVAVGGGVGEWRGVAEGATA